MPMATRVSLLLLVWVPALLASSMATADPQSKSFSNWSLVGGQPQAVFSIAAREMTRLPQSAGNPDLDSLWAGQLSRWVLVTTNGQPCQLQFSRPRQASEGYLRASLGWECPGQPSQLQTKIGILRQVAPGHIHFASFSLPGQSRFERIYTRRVDGHVIALTAAEAALNNAGLGTVLLSYIEFGFEHILIGLDHIAFLLTLLILSGRVRDILFIVTGFTLGHSITLSLAVLGLVHPDTALVEALIGFTIAIVAVENVLVTAGGRGAAVIAATTTLAALALFGAFAGIGPPAMSLLGLALFSGCYLLLSDDAAQARQLRPLVTTLFGLVHGFGFASVLLEVGLPDTRILPALAGFNIGVELGQIAIVLGLALVGLLLNKYLTKNYYRLASDGLSSALCGLGVYWFIQRLYF